MRGDGGARDGAGRVVVIGAGVGGLAAAARLAALGHRVTVLEAADAIGGKLGTYERDGYVFDTGPSLVTMPQVFEDLFDATGAPLADAVDLERLDVACRYTFPDGTGVDLPGRIEEIPAALDAALGAGTGEQWAAFTRDAAAIWDVAEQPFLRSPIGRGTLAAMSSDTANLTTIAPWLSLRAFGARRLHDPRLRAMLDRYATYTGSDPRRAPSALATVPYAEQAFGSWYVRGGLRALGAAIARRARDRGAEIRTGVRVASIEHDGARVTGVVTAGGERVAADVVVANADASQVYGELLAGAGARRRLRALRRATPSLAGFVLLLALEGLPASLRERAAHHRVLFPRDYDDEFDAVFGVGRYGRWHGGGGPRPVDDPTVYVTAPQDAAIVPGGSAGLTRGEGAWFVLVNAPRHDPARGADWDAPGLAEAYGRRILDVMARRGLDVRPYVRWVETRSPADLERSVLAPGGAIYGTSSNKSASAFLRPANRGPVRGLYLVGGSSHPGGGLPLVTLSAEITAGLIGPA
ncbi:phytoene desaturase family protein [Litorihabitans aurantiacus]|uniref:Phytoene desaturase n=1 Tax=Litorihabitans aurantiacus TaxID=1930061 RepID=A0AA37XGZ7_9MICO|nr:phytoene desaturase family protein [Litorihabitans aurantiacus]GMA32856.1 phytoene desaturase [Litorihabitans aurantiacus]